MSYHNLSIEDTLQLLNTNKDIGLTSKEVSKRQKTYGYNQLESPKKKSLFLRFLSQFADFMIIILILAAFISFFVSYVNGETDYIDPIIIFIIIIMNALIGLIQETKAEHSLEALKKLSDRERKIMFLRFGLGGGDEMTQKDVADLLGISQSYISRLEKKIILRLKKEIAKME